MAVWNSPLGFSQAWETLFQSLVQTRTHNSQFSMCSGELFTWLVPVPYAGVSPGAYKKLRILSSSLYDYGWSTTFNGHSRVIGWISFWPLILTCTKHTCPSWWGKNYQRSIGAFWSTTNMTSPTFRLSVASLHFLWVLSVARNSSLQCLQNSCTR